MSSGSKLSVNQVIYFHLNSNVSGFNCTLLVHSAIISKIGRNYLWFKQIDQVERLQIIKEIRYNQKEGFWEQHRGSNDWTIIGRGYYLSAECAAEGHERRLIIQALKSGLFLDKLLEQADISQLRDFIPYLMLSDQTSKKLLDLRDPHCL